MVAVLAAVQFGAAPTGAANESFSAPYTFTLTPAQCPELPTTISDEGQYFVRRHVRTDRHGVTHTTLHVSEHIVQLIQVYLLGVPDDAALGLLGYLFQFQGTEEWLHLVCNVSYALALWLLFLPLRDRVPDPVPAWAFWVFAVGGAGLETWHVVEHGVIIRHVVAHHGCPCPGIGDAALGLSDTFLHFWYNTIAYLATLVPFSFVIQAPPTPETVGMTTRTTGVAADAIAR